MATARKKMSSVSLAGKPVTADDGSIKVRFLAVPATDTSSLC